MGYGNNGQGKYVEREATGKLFYEGNNKKNPKAPDWTGYIIHNGVKIKLAGWLKQGPQGDSVSLKVSEMRQDAPQGNKPAYQPQPQPQTGYGRQAPPQGYRPSNPAPAWNGGAPNAQYPSGPVTAAPGAAYYPPGPQGNGAPLPTDDMPF